MIVVMPPSSLPNSTQVRVESLLPGTTAHLPGCREIKRASLPVTVAQALVHLEAQWCHVCMRRRG